MKSKMSAMGKKVRVWVRTRPTANFAHNMVDLEAGKTINIHCPRTARPGEVNNQKLDWSFKLDGILHNASQEHAYNTVASDIVSAGLQGYNGTLLCYGQTGGGKTFTMTGATENYKHRGLIPRALAQIYKDIDQRPESAVTVRISYLEIYNETMFDLLSTLPETLGEGQQGPLTVVEDGNGVYVKGLSCHLAQTEEEALNLLFEGETNRAIATHSLNRTSSRSHCIFTVYLESHSRVQSDAKYTVSKLNFVDLAGSERLGKTRSEGKIQQEAMYINKSLSFLEQTVIALADRRRDHIPFRQTKLTHYLKDSIGGNCNTLMVANIWGEASQIEETISTLRFACRMMCVAIEPAMNEQYDPVLLVRKLEKEIRALKQELAMHDTLTNRSQISYEALSEQQRYEIKQQVRQFSEGGLDEIDIVNVRQIQGVFEAFKDIYGQQEKEIEERIRIKYMLVDKSDPSSIAAAQQAGVAITDEGELVGEPDGRSFGIGPAPSSAKPTASSVVNAKKREVKRGKSKDRASPAPKAASPAQSTKGGPDGTASMTPSVDKKEDREETGTPTSSSGGPTISKPPRPSTPPPRGEAFEEFKKEVGSEIHRILAENKDILSGKKKAYADLARQINYTKSEIDSSTQKLTTMKAEREAQSTDMGEANVVISEEEFLEIQHLRDLKAAYRQDFTEFRNLKTEVQYCQKLVDQCRQRLIQEFDAWYSENFLADGEVQKSSDVGFGGRSGSQPPQKGQDITGEDEQEKFERLQMALLMENPDSAAFYNAKMRTQRRKTYEAAMTQAQPSARKMPGTPTRMIRSQPPTNLVSY